MMEGFKWWWVFVCFFNRKWSTWELLKGTHLRKTKNKEMNLFISLCLKGKIIMKKLCSCYIFWQLIRIISNTIFKHAGFQESKRKIPGGSKVNTFFGLGILIFQMLKSWSGRIFMIPCRWKKNVLRCMVQLVIPCTHGTFVFVVN